MGMINDGRTPEKCGRPYTALGGMEVVRARLVGATGSGGETTLPKAVLMSGKVKVYQELRITLCMKPLT